MTNLSKQVSFQGSMFKLLLAGVLLALITCAFVASSARAQVPEVLPGEVATAWMVISHEDVPHSRFVFEVEAQSAMPKDVFQRETCDLAAEFTIFLSQLGYNPEADDRVTGMYFQPEEQRPKIERVAAMWPAKARAKRIELQRQGVSGNWTHELMFLGVRPREDSQASAVVLSCEGKSYSRARRTSPMWQYYK